VGWHIGSDLGTSIFVEGMIKVTVFFTAWSAVR
jgi:hypothetical protein